MSTGLLPGVTVRVLTPGDPRAGSTHANGQYRIDRLPAGRFVVTAELAGFQTLKTEISFRAGRAETWDAVMTEIPPRPSEPIETFIRAFVGPNPEKCGELHAPVSRPELLKSLECAREASRKKRTVVVFLEMPSIDSRIVSGLLGTTDGRMFLFSYDSAPCGGPHCEARFLIERCHAPEVTGPGSEMVRFTCPRT
jgi:hypothetical protein